MVRASDPLPPRGSRADPLSRLVMGYNNFMFYLEFPVSIHLCSARRIVVRQLPLISELRFGNCPTMPHPGVAADLFTRSLRSRGDRRLSCPGNYEFAKHFHKSKCYKDR